MISEPDSRTHDPGRSTKLAPGDTNAIGHMLGVLGDEWNLFILGNALMGTARYNEFKALLPISSFVLTNRLQSLVGSGLLVRRIHPDRRTRTQYLPTARSRPLWAVFLAMWSWERGWATTNEGATMDMVHRRCGRTFSPVLRCRNCRAFVVSDDVSLQFGPSGEWGRSVPAAATRRRGDYDANRYPQMMRVFGNRWAAAIVVAAFLGATRFNEFQTQLGIPPSSLAQRLQTLCVIGVLSTSPVDEGSPRAQYLLTEKGRALLPVVALTLNWAQHWFHAPEGNAVVLTHSVCGAPFRAVLACNQCFRPLSGEHIWPQPAQ